MAGGVARLGQRILDEGTVRLWTFGNAQFLLRNDFPAERRENLAKFAQLAGIAGGDDEFHAATAVF